MGIKYLNIYETVIRGNDSASGKPTVNTFYHRCGTQVAGPPAYGADVPGPSSLLTWLTNFRAEMRIAPFLWMSINWKVADFTSRQITGWGVGGTPRIVINAENVNPSIIHTVGNHNLVNGSPVTITGALGNTAVNGVWIATVTGPTTFSVPVAGNGLYTGGGTWQLTVVPAHLTYGDTATLPGVVGVDEGSIGGDALPLINTLSLFKRSEKAGRNWRGRNSMSPLGESTVLNGKFLAASLLQIRAAWDNFLIAAGRTNGGTDAQSGYMYEYVLSKTLALQQTPPFTESNSYSARVNSLIVRPNMGSIVRRKPRLTAPING